MGGANSESKECMERCNRPISYKNALLHKVSGIKISFTKNFFWGGGGGGGGDTYRVAEGHCEEEGGVARS